MTIRQGLAIWAAFFIFLVGWSAVVELIVPTPSGLSAGDR